LLAKTRRAATDGKDGVYSFDLRSNAQLPDEAFATIARLRKGVMKVLEERLSQRGMTSIYMTEEYLSRCLPKR
jgi:hypothetical protein